MTLITDYMASTPRTGTVRGGSAAGGRDPAHELYEHAAGLLTTAQALEAATHAPGAVAAVAVFDDAVFALVAGVADAAGQAHGQGGDDDGGKDAHNGSVGSAVRTGSENSVSVDARKFSGRSGSAS